LKNARTHLKWAKNILMGVILALAVVSVVLRLTVLSYWTIPQNGMYPNLAAGSKFFGINTPYKTATDVQRGDIVVFEQFKGNDLYIYIWRVGGCLATRSRSRVPASP
jgi:signal peptidase I